MKNLTDKVSRLTFKKVGTDIDLGVSGQIWDQIFEHVFDEIDVYHLVIENINKKLEELTKGVK